MENLEILWKQHLLRWTISSHVDSGICQKGFSQQWKEDVWRMQNVQNGKQYSADASSSQKSRENARIHSRILLLCLFKRFGLISMLPTSIQLYFLIKISRFLSLVINGSFFLFVKYENIFGVLQASLQMLPSLFGECCQGGSPVLSKQYISSSPCLELFETQSL